MTIRRPASNSFRRIGPVKRARLSIGGYPKRPISLDWDFFYALQAYLKMDPDQDVISRLSRVSKGFYSMFEPLTTYHLQIVKLDHCSVSWRLSSDKTNGFLASTRRCPFETGLDASNQAIKKKRYERMRRVTNLLLQDIPSLKSFCRSINPDPSSTMNKETFLNVTHLTLGHSLTRHLGLTADGKYHDLLSTLQDSLSPTHLCVDYSSGMDKAGFYTRKYQQDPLGDYERTWLEWEFDREGLWDYIHKVGMTNVVGALMARWTRLEEVVLHGVQEQSLPISTQNTRIRVFYQDDLRGSLSNVRYGGSTFRADLEKQSTVRMQIEEMGVVVSLLAPPRCSYEFIGVGHCPRAISIELQEEEEANQNATERFWRYFEQRDLREIIEHQVLFSTRTRAEPCVCCGRK